MNRVNSWNRYGHDVLFCIFSLRFCHYEDECHQIVNSESARDVPNLLHRSSQVDMTTSRDADEVLGVMFNFQLCFQ